MILELQNEIHRIRKELREKEDQLSKLEANENADQLTDIAYLKESGESEVEKEDLPFKLVTIYQGHSGDTPSTGDVVKIHFTIALTTEPGKIVEESRERYKGIPFSFILGKGQIIAGFEYAVQNMQRGEAVEFMMPSKFAYESESFGNLIPAHQDLFCHLELIDFHKARTPKRTLIVQLNPPQHIRRDPYSS